MDLYFDTMLYSNNLYTKLMLQPYKMFTWAAFGPWAAGSSLLIYRVCTFDV